MVYEILKKVLDTSRSVQLLERGAVLMVVEMRAESMITALQCVSGQLVMKKVMWKTRFVIAVWIYRKKKQQQQ